MKNLLDFSWVVKYIYIMKDEIAIPDHAPDDKEEDLRKKQDLKAAAIHRENYALVRDKQASENNEAITRRLAKEEKSKDKDKI